jgi:7-cyano-7-deazaguanine reductase
MERLGTTINEARNEFISRVRSDLAALFDIDVRYVSFNLFSPNQRYLEDTSHLDIDVQDLYDLVDISTIEPVDTFKENIDYLKTSECNTEFRITCNAWRTNCEITHAPDWATVLIHYKGSKGVDFESLVRYIASYRDMSKFHENSTEILFSRLMQVYSPDELLVCSLYTRRGGLDIVPVRATSQNLLYRIANVVSTEQPLGKTIHQ